MALLPSLPTLRLKTLERRVGLLGVGSSGKTVLLTSLLDQLAHHDPARFVVGDRKNPAGVHGFKLLDADDGWRRFPYEDNRERIARRSWPVKTSDRFMAACRFERSDWKYATAEMRLFDLPGERVADLPMLVEGGFKAWSANTLALLRRDEWRGPFANFLKVVESSAPVEVLAGEYRRGLWNAFRDYRTLPGPSTFVIGTDGTVLRRSDPDHVAEARPLGLALREPVVPLPDLPANMRPVGYDKVEQHFDRYCREVVRPFYKTLRSCDALVVLVDLLKILGDSLREYNDQLSLLSEVMAALDPSESGLRRNVRHVADRLLPTWAQPKWVHRVAFAAPMADRVHPADRQRLLGLLREMTRTLGDGLRHRGVNVCHLTLAAVNSSRALSEGEALPRQMTGPLMFDPSGARLGPGEGEQKFPVSAVPEQWPANWHAGQFLFPELWPRIPERINAVPEQFGLDELFNFVCW